MRKSLDCNEFGTFAKLFFPASLVFKGLGGNSLQTTDCRSFIAIHVTRKGFISASPCTSPRFCRPPVLLAHQAGATLFAKGDRRFAVLRIRISDHKGGRVADLRKFKGTGHFSNRVEPCAGWLATTAPRNRNLGRFTRSTGKNRNRHDGAPSPSSMKKDTQADPFGKLSENATVGNFVTVKATENREIQQASTIGL